MPGTLTYVDELRSVGVEAGLAAVGFAAAEPFESTRVVLEARKAEGLHGGMAFTYKNPTRSTDPSLILRGARSLVVGAYAYRRADPPPPPGRVSARVARFARADHYRALREGLDAIASHLRAGGWQARVMADDNSLVDRAAAERAGIGWFGKSANVLVPGLGSWVVLGSVITDALLPGDPTVADGCGTCRRCLDGCPTGAIVAPGVVDARRCLAWLLEAPGSFPREWRAALGDRLYGCDECQEVCPPNHTADRHRPPAPDRAEVAWVDVLGLLGASDDEILVRHGRWYIPDRDLRYFRRNLLVVLGNSRAGAAPEVIDALRAYLGHPDPLLRAHAVWAARQLGRPDLLDVVAGDSAPDVVEELAAG